MRRTPVPNFHYIMSKTKRNECNYFLYNEYTGLCQSNMSVSVFTPPTNPHQAQIRGLAHSLAVYLGPYERYQGDRRQCLGSLLRDAWLPQ